MDMLPRLFRPSPGSALTALLLLALPALGSTLHLPPPDLHEVLLADQQSGELRSRYAVPIDLQLDPERHGAWSNTAQGGRIWRLRVQVAGARTLSLHFDRLQLPAGARLFLRGARDEYGPLGAADRALAQFWTPVVRGDWLELALLLPQEGGYQLATRRLFYGFRGFGSAAGGLEKAGRCNVNVACEVADEWRDQVRSVARVSVGGVFLCSGQLLNNTAQDRRPLFLTAAHCLDTVYQPSSIVVYFNYEASDCGGEADGKLLQAIEGANLLASSAAPGSLSVLAGSDFALLELWRVPPPEFDVFYSGWDNRDVAPRQAVGIHHPSGDEKSISIEGDPLSITAYGQGTGSLSEGLPPTHLRVSDWDLGTTEGGSSGSGLWNTQRRLVGQLSGGAAACGNDQPDWYGRFHEDWFRFPGAKSSVASHLDPLGLGVEFLDGLDPMSQDADQPVQGPSVEKSGGSGGLGLGFLVCLLGMARRRRT